MARKRIVLLLLLCLMAGQVRAWGPLGHRIISQLAEPLLVAQTRDAMQAIIGRESLASASTWADEMRGDPSPFWQQRAGPLHYVTVPPGRRYQDVGPPAQGDAVTGLKGFRALLLDSQASLESRQLALRFAVHIVQDLHQPLHVGNGLDRGGTRTLVHYRGREISLHRLWDTELLLAGDLGEESWVSLLTTRMTRAQVEAWSVADPLRWIAESASLRELVYPEDGVINENYRLAHQGQLELRLAQAAVRTATWLNTVFSHAADRSEYSLQ